MTMVHAENTRSAAEPRGLAGVEPASAKDSGSAKERLNLVVVGHVDHGKSTVVGRLLADTDSLPEGKIEQVRAKCEAAGKQFEYAFLLDALQDEQAQGITIDAARIFFETAKRHYIIIDAPGHIEFLKNMVTGASHAEAALLVIDAEEGVQENSRRHGYMLSLLGVKSIIVVVNKMDLVNWDQAVFDRITAEYGDFLGQIGVKPLRYIPISGLLGANIAVPSTQMNWYDGPTVLAALDGLQTVQSQAQDVLRMYVQDVYKFTRYGDSRRIVAGTIDSGSIREGDRIVFYPSGKSSEIKSVEAFNAPGKTQSNAGEAVGFTLREQLYITRGEFATRAADPRPEVSTRVRASVFWLGTDPLVRNRDYQFRVGTAKVSAQLESVDKVIDASDLNKGGAAASVERNNVAEVVFKLNRAIAFDTVDFFQTTSRFVVIDNFRIAGGGIIREALADSHSRLREQKIVRNTKWIKSFVPPSERAERYSQRPVLLVVTGPTEADRKSLAKAIEANLFAAGKIVYFLGIGNILHGLDADIEGREDIGQEHIRRLAELANIMLDAGLILIVSAASLNAQDMKLIGALVGEDNLKSVFLGESEDVSAFDLQLPQTQDVETSVAQVKQLLVDSHVIFRPW